MSDPYRVFDPSSNISLYFNAGETDQWVMQKFNVSVKFIRAKDYLADRQLDNNVTRQKIHPLWTFAQSVAEKELVNLRSDLTPDQIIEIERALVIERYVFLCVGNTPPPSWGIPSGLYKIGGSGVVGLSSFVFQRECNHITLTPGVPRLIPN